MVDEGRAYHSQLGKSRKRPGISKGVLDNVVKTTRQHATELYKLANRKGLGYEKLVRRASENITDEAVRIAKTQLSDWGTKVTPLVTLIEDGFKVTAYGVEFNFDKKDQ